MSSHSLKQIHVPCLDQSQQMPAELLQNFLAKAAIPKDKQVCFANAVQTAHSFHLICINFFSFNLLMQVCIMIIHLAVTDEV